MLAAANKTIDILGITCVGGNSTLENTKLNALKIPEKNTKVWVKPWMNSNSMSRTL